jgi:signal transduction histidine kinase
MPTLFSKPFGAADGAQPISTVPDASLIAFLNQFDHDLRTPLGTMAAVVELLRDEMPASDKCTESIAVLERQIIRVHGLAEALREFSQCVEQRGGDPRET